MQKDSLPTRILKIILAVLVTVLAVSALAAVTALLLYGLVLAARATMSARPLRQDRATGFPEPASLRKRRSAARRKRHRKEADSAGSRLFFVSRSAVRLQLESL